jgi:hypothetical protein
MKFLAVAAVFTTLVTNAFAHNHKEAEKKMGHDKEHSHVESATMDHDHDEAHHKDHDHKAHHPEHKDEAPAEKAKKK